ncbi:MAG: hypothetical protein EOM55_02735 [Clostridia bacterium]|nr:hypothetical protein [Clostridia bacterium]
MPNNEKQSCNICTLAKIAKERLKKNNYTNEYKSHGIDNTLCFAKYICQQKRLQEIRPHFEEKKRTYDEELYQKVCEMIENDSLQNPISALIDKDLFSSLDVEAKQYYINYLSQKFKLLKNKYYKEHTSILSM